MSPLIYALLAVITVGALGFAFVPSLLGSDRADKRRKALQGDVAARRISVASDRVRDTRRRTVQEALKTQSDALDKKRKRQKSLKSRIFQAGMKTTKAAFIRNSVILGVVIFLIAYLLRMPLIVCVILGGTIGYVAPIWYLGFKRKRYQNAYLNELPNAVEAIVRGIKSGLPLNDSIRVVARDIKEPVRSEFQRVIEQQAVGKTTTEAIQVLYDRVPRSEVNFFVVVISVQSQAGGNLSEALGNLARVLRDRKKMKNKIKAMSSEAKASAAIIGSLPFIVAGLVSVASPGYLAPLFTTTLGYIWLGVGAVLLSMGIFVMNRMIQFEY